MRKLRVMITGGGTGGHIYPLMGVVSELRKWAEGNKIDLRLKYMGQPGAFRKILDDYKIEVLPIGGSVLGFIKALWVVFWFMPNVVFSKGGRGSLPVVLASAFYLTPILFHESGAVPGFMDKVAGWFARKVTVSFPITAKYFGRKAVYTGAPVRPDLFEDSERGQEFSKKFMGFSADKPLILVLSASQGSWINNLVLENIPALVQFTQILHKTGRENYELLLPRANEIMKSVPIGLRENYLPVSYFKENIHLAYKAADLVISHAGPITISEIAALGRPSLLIASAKSNTHKLNAEEYAKTGAAIILEERPMPQGFFTDTVKSLLTDPDELKKMSDAAYTFHKKDAALNVALILLRLSRVIRTK